VTDNPYKARPDNGKAALQRLRYSGKRGALRRSVIVVVSLDAVGRRPELYVEWHVDHRTRRLGWDRATREELDQVRDALAQFKIAPLSDRVISDSPFPNLPVNGRQLWALR
jgi:hypothetical protein